MGEGSAIAWTTDTWNVLVGCSKVGSPGCEHCYAINTVHRGLHPNHRGLTVRTDAGVDWTGEVRYLPDRLEVPLRKKRGRMYFVNSLSDLFHPEALKLVHEPTGAPALAEIVAVMAAATQHTFQVLTKRPQLLRAVLDEPRFRMDVNAALLRRGVPVMRGGFESRWPANIWWGTSIEEDRYAFRARHLVESLAGVRFLSLEPLLGPLPSLDLDGIDWVIVGGESGPGWRPMDLAWARDLRDRCAPVGVAFFMKQPAAFRSGRYDELPADLQIQQFPAVAA
jgi:protein gp37